MVRLQEHSQSCLVWLLCSYSPFSSALTVPVSVRCFQHAPVDRREPRAFSVVAPSRSSKTLLSLRTSDRDFTSRSSISCHVQETLAQSGRHFALINIPCGLAAWRLSFPSASQLKGVCWRSKSQPKGMSLVQHRCLAKSRGPFLLPFAGSEGPNPAPMGCSWRSN